jgi:hypothetical protein
MQSPKQSDRSFGLTFACVFAVVFVVALFGFGVRLDWALWVAGIFAVSAMAAPGVLLPANRLWGCFAGRLGQASNYLLLGIFLYLFVTPIGLVMRLCGRDPMARGFRRTGSYWTPVERGTDGDTLRDMF